MKRLSKSAALGLSALVALGASALCSAQTVSEIAADVKAGLERCGEFQGRPFGVPNFFGGDGQGVHAYHFSGFGIENNLLRWKKISVTRTHGARRWSGSGDAAYYTVNLADLSPDALRIDEVRTHRQREGVFFVELKCRGDTQCIHEQARRLTPPHQTSDDVTLPVSRWVEGPTLVRHLNGARMQICEGSLGESNAMAEALRLELRVVLNQVMTGAVVNVEAAPAGADDPLSDSAQPHHPAGALPGPTVSF